MATATAVTMNPTNKNGRPTAKPINMKKMPKKTTAIPVSGLCRFPCLSTDR